MKKIKNLTWVRDVKNLATPLSQNLPVLVMDCLDRSLYVQSPSQKGGLALKEAIGEYYRVRQVKLHFIVLGFGDSHLLRTPSINYTC